MAIKRSSQPEEIGKPAPGWYWNYTSMALLLVAFFVAMIASRVITKREEQLRIQQQLKAIQEKIVKQTAGRKNLEKGVGAGVEKTSPTITGDMISVEIDPTRGVILRLKESVLFEVGKAELREEAKNVLDMLYEDVFKDLPNNILIEGHTDNVPIHTPQFPSNWELSTARATSVARYLIEQKGFPPRRLAAMGCGEFRPIADNGTEEGRAKNRRVEFIIRPTVRM
jgi:chemotaxis protein MotB